MTIRGQLVELLARYDDATWTALANRGLLRRATKDLDTVPIAIEAESDDAVNITVADHHIRFTRTGPAGATCDCPSPVLCQHVITAGLWLTRQPPSAPSTDSGPKSSSAEAAPSDDGDALHQQLMNISQGDLITHAGRPGVRWAHQYLSDLDQPLRLDRNTYLEVGFAHPEVVVRYLGGGLDGLVLDQKIPSPERIRVAAVLAWQQAHGLNRQPPPQLTRPSAPTAAALSLDESRRRLRSAVLSLLTDVVRIGVSHLSPAVLERFTTLAVWAQGAEYHRCALALRRLTDQVELQLSRSAAADDLRMFDDLAVAYALTTALDRAAQNGHTPPALIGRARNSYDSVRTIDLVGLGGHPWRSGSGYHGLTCIFWSPERGRFYSWTDTRPESLPGFDARQRWQQPAPWTGWSTPAAASGRLLTLTAAQISADARISGVETTAARISPLTGEQLTGRLQIHERWSELEALTGRGRSLLATPDPNAAWAVLRPTSTAATWFDPTRQTLQWPLIDNDGALLLIELPWTRLHAHAIGRIETLADTALPDGHLIVAQLYRRHGQLTGFPLALINPALDNAPLDALHFDSSHRTSDLVAALQRAGTPDRTLDSSPGAANMFPAAVAELRAVLERLAQRGTSGALPGAVHRELTAAHRRLRQTGWTVFTDFDLESDPADLLLRSHALLQQVERVAA